MKSEVFETTITGKYHALQLPEDIVRPFLEKNLNRVKVKVSFKGKELVFHGAIQRRKGNYYMMFGKRYQAALGVFPNDYFQMQFLKILRNTELKCQKNWKRCCRATLRRMKSLNRSRQEKSAGLFTRF